jgi:general stress protein YciG
MSSISQNQQISPQEVASMSDVVGPQLQSAPPAQELRPDAPPTSPVADAEHPRRPRGFAAIDRKLLAEIASKGGKAAHSAGTAHEFTSDEARAAGRKGGLATHAKRRKIEP